MNNYCYNRLLAFTVIFMFAFCTTASPIHAAPVLKITEVFFQATTTTVKDFIEIYCVDDGNNGAGADIKNYSIYYVNYASSDIQTTMIKLIGDADNNPATPQESTIIKTGQFIVLYFDPDYGIDDTAAVNGVITLYYPSDKILKDDNSIVAISSTSDYSGKFDCVCWDNGYYTNAKILAEIENLYNAGLWSRKSRNGIILPPGLDRRLPAGNSYSSFKSKASLSRYLTDAKLGVEADSYLNWIITDKLTPGALPNIPAFQYSYQHNIVSIFDTPNDKGGNLTLIYNKAADYGFYAYNVYVCTQPVNLMDIPIKPVIIKTNIEDVEATITVGDFPNKTDYYLLENMTNYYTAVTITDIYGREFRNVVLSAVAKPKINHYSNMILWINKVFVKGYGSLAGVIELYCVDDGNNGVGVNLAGYSIGEYSNLETVLAQNTKYRGELKIFGNTIIKTGDFCVVEINNNLIDSKSSVGNQLRAYTKSKTSLATSDVLILYNPFGLPLDCLPYSESASSMSSTKLAALTAAYNYGLWNSAAAENTVITGKLTNPAAIVRKNKLTNTTSKNDWTISVKPTVAQDANSATANQIFGNLQISNKIIMVDGSDINRAAINLNFDIYAPAIINIRVFDAEGRLITKIAQNEKLGLAGNYSYVWNGKDERDRIVPTGIYIILFDFYSQMGLFHKTDKITVVAARKL